MADPKSPTPESPTTARPLEMDDDDVQDANVSLDDGTAPVKPTASTTAASSGETATPTTASALKTTVEDEEPAASTTAPAAEVAAPPKPPRPLTEQQKNEQTLKEAFPTVDVAVIKAVLTASRGSIESAFHALLEMTDPNAVAQEPDASEAAPPPQPPRPSSYLQAGAKNAGRLSPNSQLLADEEYARQLAQHYENEAGRYEARTSSSRSAQGGPPYPPRTSSSRGGNDSLKPSDMWGDKDHSFIDDDLPVITENLRKGFVETQTKFNTWFSGIKKKIDEEFNLADDDEDDDGSPGGARRQQQYEREARRQQGGRGGGFSRPPPRRSGDYDADPAILSDDFASIQLHGDGTPVRNPNLFRPPPSTSPRPGSERKVAFNDKTETIDMYGASPKLPAKDGAATAAASTGAKTSKWQPMSSVDPTPLADNDDPFSLGDSEDEKDATTASKPAATGKPDAGAAASADDAERLRKAAAEAMADSLVEDKPKA